MELIRLSGIPPGSLIFDPFAGSGIVGVAALRLGMSYIGCEIDRGFALHAARRLDLAALAL